MARLADLALNENRQPRLIEGHRVVVRDILNLPKFGLTLVVQHLDADGFGRDYIAAKPPHAMLVYNYGWGVLADREFCTQDVINIFFGHVLRYRSRQDRRG